MIFQGANSSEHGRFTQHSFKALSKSAKSVMLRPPSFLHFKIVVFLIFGFLYFHVQSKIILLTSHVKQSGVSSTLQTKVSFDKARVLAIFIQHRSICLLTTKYLKFS